MTADYTISAVNDLRQYIWYNLQQSGIYKRNNYFPDGFSEPLVPIIPAQELPEFNNLLPGKPYITYDYEVKPIQQDWWIQEELLVLTIASTDYDEVNKVIMLMQDLFRRYDFSAADINAWNPNTTFHFHYTAIEAIVSPQPFKTEGGHLQGEVHILYKYTRETNSSSNGRF
jgi:hypothetical protein